MRITAVIYQWGKLYGRRWCGQIHYDLKGRFKDGSHIVFTPTDQHRRYKKGDILLTDNSSYLLGDEYNESS